MSSPIFRKAASMKTEAYQTDGPPYPITIERREIIAVIHPGNGPETMIEAAFKACGLYLSDSINGQPLAIQFSANDMVFRITVEPE